jgi:hypothetical protein
VSFKVTARVDWITYASPAATYWIARSRYVVPLANGVGKPADTSLYKQGVLRISTAELT